MFSAELLAEFEDLLINSQDGTISYENLFGDMEETVGRFGVELSAAESFQLRFGDYNYKEGNTYYSTFGFGVSPTGFAATFSSV